MQPQQPYAGPPGSPHPAYDFIFDPQKAPRKPLFNFGGGNSVLGRVVIVMGGIFVLLIVFVIVKNLLAGGSNNVPSLIRVVQAQQELIHLSNSALLQQNVALSDTTKNFASTTHLSVSSAQTQLLGYLGKNHQKVSAKQMALGISTSVDNQLTASLAASTYDQTFQQVMQSQLSEYSQVLKQAYNLTKGTNGRKLLSADYNGAQLLQQQLGVTKE